MTTPSCFPELPFLDVEHVRKTIAGLTVVVRTTTTTSICPVCGQASSRVHIRYTRTLADLPWSGRTVQLHVQVRRFFCINRSCPRTTFAEPLATLASRSARRTSRLTEMLSALALVTGGEAGERLSSRLGMYCSGPTLLRLLRRLPLPPAPPPHVIGLDDWAWHKNLRYSTIVVDLERRRPVALLPDRSASSVIAWLQAHPQVDIVCRDRTEAFADAARTGAPHALQIADRWHVVFNLREAPEKVLARHRKELKHVRVPSEGVTSQPEPDQATTSPASPPSSPRASSRSRLATERAARRERRQVQYEQVRALAAKGMRYTEIARYLGMHRETVATFARAETFPERNPSPTRPHLLDPYKPYLLRRWNEGCFNATQLAQEIAAQGYTGATSKVIAYLVPLRKAQRAALQQEIGQIPTSNPAMGSATPRAWAWLVLRRAEQRDKEESAELARLRAIHPEIEQACQLVQEWLAMMRTRHPEALRPWLAKAQTSGIDELRRFANGVFQDLDAVEASLRFPWSNGQTEGQITRLKLIKRSMYGRGHLDVLEQRVLHAS